MAGVDVEREHAIGEFAVGRGRAVAGERAADQFANESEARALVLAEGAYCARPLRVVARAVHRQRPIDQRRIAGERSVRTDQGVGRQRLAAAARDIDLAFGDQRGRKIEQITGAPSRGTPTQKGAVDSRRSSPPKGATRIEPEALTK